MAWACTGLPTASMLHTQTQLPGLEGAQLGAAGAHTPSKPPCRAPIHTTTHPSTASDSTSCTSCVAWNERILALQEPTNWRNQSLSGITHCRAAMDQIRLPRPSASKSCVQRSGRETRMPVWVRRWGCTHKCLCGCVVGSSRHFGRQLPDEPASGKAQQIPSALSGQGAWACEHPSVPAILSQACPACAQACQARTRAHTHHAFCLCERCMTAAEALHGHRPYRYASSCPKQCCGPLLWTPNNDVRRSKPPATARISARLTKP